MCGGGARVRCTGSRYVSGANFFGEIVEWAGFAVASGGALSSVAFAFFTACNIAPRALQHHKWYVREAHRCFAGARDSATTILARAGIKSRAERLAIRDFLEAKECWLQDPDDATKLIPVYTSSEDYSLNDTFDDNIQSLEITLTEAHKN